VSEFIIATPYAHISSKFRTNYRSVIILEVESGYRPLRVDKRDKKIICIVKRWDCLNVKGGTGTAFAKAEREARHLVENRLLLRMMIASQSI